MPLMCQAPATISQLVEAVALIQVRIYIYIYTGLLFTKLPMHKIDGTRMNEGEGEDEGAETNSKCHYNSHLVSFLTAKELYIQKFI